jgi:hypothetical protein
MELKYNSNLWLCQIKRGWGYIERSESGRRGIRITIQYIPSIPEPQSPPLHT